VPAQAGVLQGFVADLESSLGTDFLPATVSQGTDPMLETASAEGQTIEPAELEPIGQSAPTSFGVKENEMMGEFVADLEESLGPDFLKGAPVPETAPEPQAPTEAVATSQPAPAPPAAAASAAAASAGSPISAHAATPVAQQSVAAPASPKPQAPAKTSPITPNIPAAAKPSPFGEDASVDLAEMFGELKQDLEAGAPTAADEDPETHYNLGIAFREMGLLDEAIGELQKTCQAVDRGHPFPNVIQTYTWLAQCFLDKGVPEAAIRWYQKALAAPGVDEETRTALHYELAAAYETAGDRPAALKHFMEVYGRNIDYRDVAERIKPLKS
jgi:TolA-binding protein